MEIYFLTPEQAYPRLLDLNIDTECTRSHHNAITTFTSDQKSWLIGIMNDIKKSYKLKLGRIEFVLFENGVYWDFPFTWGHTMIMMTPAIFTQPRKQLMKILVHEWVHLDQRRNIQKYEHFYRSLGFKKEHIDFGGLKKYLLPNPDAEKYEWMWQSPDGGPSYVPAALLYECKFRSVLLDYSTMTVHEISNIPSYYEHFGVKRQLYHPNEISAHLIADYLIDGKTHNNIAVGKLIL